MTIVFRASKTIKTLRIKLINGSKKKKKRAVISEIIKTKMTERTLLERIWFQQFYKTK